MNERWVCKRCFADNDDTHSACHRCGLIRGAEATPADQAAWTAEASASAGPVQAGWGKWLRLAWIPVLVVVLAVGYFVSARRDSSGQLENAGTIAVTDLRVGDCFNVGELETITDVEGVPCSEAHEFEVFHLQDHSTAAFPTDPQFDTIFDELCLGQFEAYVGAPWATSEIFASMMTPTEQSFEDGDRGYICYLFDLSDDALTSSQRGAAR